MKITNTSYWFCALLVTIYFEIKHFKVNQNTKKADKKNASKFDRMRRKKKWQVINGFTLKLISKKLKPVKY